MKEPQILEEHLEYGEFLEDVFKFLDMVYEVEQEYWSDSSSQTPEQQEQSWTWLREFLDRFTRTENNIAGLSPEEKKALYKEGGLLMSATIVRKKECLEIINTRSWEVAHAQIMEILRWKRESGFLIEEIQKRGIYRSDQDDSLKTSVLNELRDPKREIE